ncbi:hypothetical protein AMATHDRAFT_70230 [Amanita thiersii Skay4041]|uniref:NAD-dependent epimerase/dehydratase domain-containing protein n=1 Tax=Amanita thiersii Skay4041 TaxID=703135 RepID=A0A2A9NEZ2_9AGAR|nr:hypothetical protein AMATHDRAFT_70230 [Amanita thiersii Skay4041]
MAVIAKSSKVLVTGANGFVAIWLVRSLLEQGFSVRGAVRSADKGVYLTNMFKPYGDKFGLAVVGDITKVGAFDEAVKGVDAIVHCATPVTFDADEPKDIIDPAVNGTLGILTSAKHAPQLKRITILGSIANIIHEDEKPLVFNENDWNDQALQAVEVFGRKAPGVAKYAASKILAEKAAWKFHKDNKSQLSWDLVVIHPVIVLGPLLHDISSPNELNISMKAWYDAVVHPKASTELGDTSWVDVRDMARAIIRSLEVKEAGGERIIVCGGESDWQDWRNTANSLSPSPIPSHAPGTEKALPIGNPDATRDSVFKVRYDTSKAQRILGLTYRTKEETARDILAEVERRGW